MPGAPASINVVSQPIAFPINTSPGIPLVAKVVDANGLPISGVTVTFMPKGNQAGCSFAGGVNSAVTNGSGIATSAVITANGVVGSYLVEGWVGTWPPVSGAVGPAIFSLSNSPGWASQNIAAVQALWTTLKASLATVQGDLATVANDQATLEGLLIQMANLGATDVSEWVRTKLRQSRVGYVPYVSPVAGANVPIPNVFAVQPGTSRDLSLTDQSLVGATGTGQAAGLS
jgi:hypothetical protein